MALATNTTPGEIQLAGDLAGNNDATAPALTNTAVTPGQYTQPQIIIDSKGRITDAQGGDPSAISALLTPASETESGVVQAGAGLSVASNATSGYQDLIYTTTLTGGTLSGLDGCASYTIDLNIDANPIQNIVITGGLATIQDVIDALNGEIIGGTVSINGGNIKITSSTPGRGSFVEIVTDGLFGCITNFDYISGYVRGTADCEMYASDATTSSKGIVQIGTGIDVSNGLISVDITGYTLQPATTSLLGGVIVPTSGNLTVDVSGNLGLDEATTLEIGGVKVPGGDGLSLDGSGSLTYSYVEDPGDYATETTKGIVEIGGNIDVSAGVISVPFATNVSKGVIQIGDGLSVTSGVVSANAAAGAPIATTTTLGVVKVPVSGGIAIDGSGNISTSPGTNTNLGVVKSGDTNNITITAGDIDIGPNVVTSLVAHTFTGSQTVATTTLSSSSSVNVDASTSNNFELTLGTNVALQNPTNISPGQTFVFVLRQDGTGGRTLSFGSNYKFRQGVTPTNSLSSNSVDIMSCISDGTNLFCSYNVDFA